MSQSLASVANQNSVSEARRKGTLIIVIEIIIIILILIHFGIFTSNNNNLNTVQNQICIQQQSILCDDFNPCTIDYIESTCGNLSDTGQSCESFQCVNIPLANGSCCNTQDVCYAPDPNKACVFGTCKSPDPTLCLGYCTTDSDCEVLPLNIEFDAYFTSCQFNSCVTTVLFTDVAVPDPLSLLNFTDVYTNRNIGSCLQATCQTPNCFYTYTCAPFINVTNNLLKKKRVNEEGLENPDFTKINNKIIYYNLPGYFDDEYYIINTRLNELLWTLLNNSNMTLNITQ